MFSEGKKETACFPNQMLRRARVLHEKQDVRTELAHPEAEMKSLRADFDRLTLEVQALRGELGTSAHRLQDVRAKLGRRAQEVLALKAELSRAAEREQGLQDQNAELLKEIARLNEEVVARDRTISGIYAGRIWSASMPIFWLHHTLQCAFASFRHSFEGLLPRDRTRQHPLPAPGTTNTVCTLTEQAHGGRAPAVLVPLEGAAPVCQAASPPQVAPRTGQYDVICFSILEWDFAFQRPHQMVSQFAERGHRVFYISHSRFCSPEEPSGFALRPLRERVYEVCVADHQATNVYGRELTDSRMELLFDSVDSLRRVHNIVDPVILVQLPFWGPLALELRRKFGWKIVYDCMDEWNDFPGWDKQVKVNERKLVEACDLLLVSSQKLFEKWASIKPNHRHLIRNAANFDHFQRARPNSFLDGIEPPIVGYFGIIAEWFDMDLLKFLARSRPEYSFVLLGWTHTIDLTQLDSLYNVHFLGQKAYHELPDYLYHFDACIIPFKVNHVTEAVDPVKFYEYVSQGKPVVSVKMPELYRYRDLLYIAEDNGDFLNKLDAALGESSPALVQARIDLARGNTWEVRIELVEDAISRLHGRSCSAGIDGGSSTRGGVA